MWTRDQIEEHIKAADNLIEIKDLAFQHIREKENISEYELQQFIITKIKERGMIMDHNPPVVAFDEDSVIPEFYPKEQSKRLKQNTFILIDLWAKIGIKDAPFADIAWVAFYGKQIPEEIKKVFNVAVKARENTLSYISDFLKNKKHLPIGKDVNNVCVNTISQAGYGKNILHFTGHSLGIEDDHAPKQGCLIKENMGELSRNLAYTIEPGIYLMGKFGVRSEIDFYISEDNELIVTTDMQKEIVKI